MGMDRSVWKTLAILSSIATMAMYAETMLIPAIPDLIEEFRLSYSIAPWILTIYLITGAVITPICGRLADMYGRKRMLLLILLIYFVGLLIGLSSVDIRMLLLARSMQGVGIAIFPVAFSIVREQFPREKMAIGQGIISSMFATGSMLGLLIGASIIHHFGWRAAFLSIMPVTILLILMIWRFIDIKRVDVKQGIDVKGSIMLAVLIVSFLLALTSLEDSSLADIRWIMFSLSAISMILLILIEKRTENPLLNLNLLLDRSVLASAIMIMLVGLSMFMVFQTIPILVKSPIPFGFGGDELDVASIQLPFSLVLLVFGPLSGFMISRLGSIRPVIFGSIVTALAFLAMLLYHSSQFLLASTLMLVAVGLSFINIGTMNIIILRVPSEQSGTLLGMVSLIRIIGSSIGPVIAGVLMQIFSVGDEMGNIFPSALAYDMIFLTALLISLLLIILTLVLRSRLT